MNKNIKGFTLIELLVVISIIALLSSVIFASLATLRIKARDSARIQNARQISLAIEQYEQSNNSYKVANAGYNNEGGGYISKGSETPGYTTSIASALKTGGYYSVSKLLDPIYGTDNYYLGVCTSTNAYNVFIKLEQSSLAQSTSSLSSACGGMEAASLGFNYVASTVGGSTGGQLNGGGGSGSAGGGNVFAAALGNYDSSYSIGAGVNSDVSTIAIQSDGKIIYGGNINSYKGIPVQHIFRTGIDGSLDTDFSLGGGTNNDVYSISIMSDNKIIIGGSFTTYNGVSRNRVARINMDGSIDNSFSVGGGPNSIVHTTAVQPDGKLLMGGHFTTYNLSPRNRIARIDTQGYLDYDFITGSGANSEIFSIAIQPDGRILIAGSFTEYNGTVRNKIARLNSDGSLDTNFNPGGGANDFIKAMTIQPDGKIIIAGAFTLYDGIARKYIARLNSDGSLDTDFDIGSGSNNYIYSVALQPDGKILIGGSLTSYNGTAVKSPVRLNTNGSLDVGFNYGGGVDKQVYAISIQPDGRIVIGGWFTSYNGTLSNSIARIL